MPHNKVKHLALIFFLAILLPCSLLAAPLKRDAAELVKDGRSGMAVIGKGLKTAKVDPKAKSSEPFLKAVKRTNAALEALEKDAKSKSKNFAKGAAKVYESSKVMEVTFARSGLKNAEIQKGVKAVADSAQALYENFSASAARKKKGGSLSEKEKQQFAKIKAEQKKFADKLSKMQSQLGASKNADASLVKTVEKMQRQSAKVQSSGLTVNDFVDALDTVAYLAGLYDGWTYYVPSTYQTYWVDVMPVVSGWDVVYYETADILIVDTSWDYFEYEVELNNDYDLVEISDAELATYDSYVDTLAVEDYEEVSADDVGDYDAYDVAADNSDYLNDEIESDIEESASMEGEQATQEEADESAAADSAATESNDGTAADSETSAETDEQHDVAEPTEEVEAEEPQSDDSAVDESANEDDGGGDSGGDDGGSEE